MRKARRVVQCYACGVGAECSHGVPLPRPCVGSKTIPTAVMSDAEASKVVFQPLGTQYVAGAKHDWSTYTVKHCRRWPDGTPMIRSDGSGTLHNPKVESIDGNVVERYLKLVPNASKGALLGRNWKTGDVEGGP